MFDLSLPGADPSLTSLSVCQVTLLIALICVRSSVWTSYSAYSYFEVVTICNLIMILVFYLVHLFRLYRMLTCISWPLSVRERPDRSPPGRWGPDARLPTGLFQYPLLPQP